MITLFSAGKSGHERKDEDILERTSFGRTVNESFPIRNISTPSTPLSLMLVSLWKELSPNMICVALGTSRSQKGEKKPL